MNHPAVKYASPESIVLAWERRFLEEERKHESLLGLYRAWELHDSVKRGTE